MRTLKAWHALNQDNQREGAMNSSSSTLSSMISSSACPGWTYCCSRTFCSLTRPPKGAATEHLESIAAMAATSARFLPTSDSDTASSALPIEPSSASRPLTA